MSLYEKRHAMLADTRLGHYFVSVARGQPGSIGNYTPRRASALRVCSARTCRTVFVLFTPAIRAESVGTNHFGANAINLPGNYWGSIFIKINHNRCLRRIVGASTYADPENGRVGHEATGVPLFSRRSPGDFGIRQNFLRLTRVG